MKRKSIYSVILICFLGLLSSANQNDKNCRQETLRVATVNNCVLENQKSMQAETAAVVPLNLFLFDL